MSLAWALPWAFAGLAALGVPLLLHLDRRRSVQRWPFAALRWIAAQARPRRTWRLVEWVLLVLRSLLIAALVAWLAQPLLRGLPREAVHWIAVAPGAAAPADAAHAVWLAPGFPAIAAPRPASDAPVSSLLREFDARLAPGDTLEVRVPAVVRGLDEAAIVLSRHVQWVVAEGDAAWRGAHTPAKPVLALRYADEGAPLLRQVRAALRAWERVPALAVRLDEAPADRPVPAHADAVLHVGSAPMAAGLAAHSLQLDAANVSPALLQSPDFPRWLHRELFGDAPAPDGAPAAAVVPGVGARIAAPPPWPLRSWLAGLAAAVFLLERLLATARRAKAAAP